jgi:DNA-binding CsgD family transcriptional regulator
LAIVHKSEPLEALATAIHAVAAGQIRITRSLVGLAELAERRDALPCLTDRQRTILSARARGEKFESIARRLFISKKVAEEHWAIVSRKFAGFLRDHSPADLERLLGLEPGDIGDWALPPPARRTRPYAPGPGDGLPALHPAGPASTPQRAITRSGVTRLPLSQSGVGR